MFRLSADDHHQGAFGFWLKSLVKIRVFMCGYAAAYVHSLCMLYCVERHVDMSTCIVWRGMLTCRHVLCGEACWHIVLCGEACWHVDMLYCVERHVDMLYCVERHVDMSTCCIVWRGMLTCRHVVLCGEACWHIVLCGEACWHVHMLYCVERHVDMSICCIVWRGMLTCRHASPYNKTCKTNERMLPHNHTWRLKF
jgi:hypothetical protein